MSRKPSAASPRARLRSRRTGRKPRSTAPVVFSKEHYRTLFETMVLGVVFQDDQGRITSANPAAERILGVRLREMRGRTFAEVPWRTVREDGSPLPAEKHPSMAALRTGRPVRDQVTGVLHPGESEPRWLLVSAVPLFRPRGRRPFQVYTTLADITEQRRAERSLRESEEQYRSLFEAAHDAIFLLEGDRFIDCNRRTLEIFGCTREQIIGQTPYRFSTPTQRDGRDSKEKALEKIAAARDGVPQFFEWRHIRYDGTPFDAGISLNRTEGGGRTLVQAIVRDITDRKRTEEALKASEATLRSVFRAVPVGVAVLDADRKYRMLNERVTDLLGYTPQELIGKSARVVYPSQEEYDQVGREFYAELRKRGHTTLETRLRRKDGTELFVLMSGAILNPDDPSAGVVATILDISERKRAEQAIREERDRAQNYLDVAGTIFVVLAPDQKVSLINRKGVEILGWPAEEIVGLNWFDTFVPPRDREATRQAFRKLMAGEIAAPEYFENPVVTRNGEERLIAWHNTVLKDLNGRIIGTLSSGMDITERKQAERDRERLLHELEAKNKELESLVYVASHDLKSPLVNIVGFGIELENACRGLTELMKGPDATEALRKAAAPILEDSIPTALAFIKASGAKMDVLINGLLRVSRAGRATLHIRPLDMNRVLAQVVAAMQFQIQQISAKVEIGPLPACQGDPDQINQVFSNLLDNALKYRDPRRPLVVRVTGCLEEREAVYCVEDTGQGIPAAYQAKIWELFHRLDPQGPVPGEGLGLTLVRRIAERHGGRVWVESEPGRGSRFFVALRAV